MTNRTQDTGELIYAFDKRGRRYRVGKGRGRMKGCSDEEYFWRSIEPMMDDRGCWEWIGDQFKRGYGRVKEGVYAHRFSFELHYGFKPKVVLHKCDNVRCVNPAHLRGGTQLENMQDKCAKGRQARFCAPPTVPCRNGHTGDFRYSYKYNKTAGKAYLCRDCRICKREYYAQKKAA